LLSAAPVHSQYTKPVYVSMPSAGNLQHLPLAAAKFKGFYNEMGITNAQLVFLRGNSINVQALVAGSVQFASAFGPSMHAMFRGEQIRILMPIFNQIPFSLVTRPEVKRLEDLKGSKIAVTFGGSTYSVLIALLSKYGIAPNFAEYLNLPGDQAKTAALIQGRASAALMAPPQIGNCSKRDLKGWSMSGMFSKTFRLAQCSPRPRSFRKSRTSFNVGSRRSQRPCSLSARIATGALK
jgi:ABC-type nitrate/sulfonate/bicarbonate transport system substrate-binding protein